MINHMESESFELWMALFIEEVLRMELVMERGKYCIRMGTSTRVVGKIMRNRARVNIYLPMVMYLLVIFRTVFKMVLEPTIDWMEKNTKETTSVGSWMVRQFILCWTETGRKLSGIKHRWEKIWFFTIANQIGLFSKKF